jgi:iron complex transport system substrate-binding protein
MKVQSPHHGGRFLKILKFKHALTQSSHATLRVVSLAPNLTEIVYALGQGPSLVGDTRQCDYPAAAKSVPKIGDYINPNIEKIISLKPNVVLATEGNPYSTIETLKKFKINSVVIHPQKISEIPAAITAVAQALNATEQGNQLSKKLELAIEEYSKTKNRHKTFLVVLNAEPIYSVGPNTWVSDLFTQGGFQNIIKDDLISYPVVSREFLTKNKPDIIFVLHNEKEAVENIYKKEFSSIYKNGDFKLVFLNHDIFVRAGPRVMEAMDILKALP